MKKISEKKLKSIFKERKSNYWYNYYIEFKINEKGTEYYNFKEKINLLGRMIFIISFVPMVLYSIFMKGVPETYEMIKDCGYEFNYERTDKLQVYRIQELKNIFE